MQCIEIVDGRSMMVGAFAFATPIAHDQLHIEKPTLYFVLSIFNPLRGPVAKSDGRQSRHTRKAFLCAGIHRVDAPLID